MTKITGIIINKQCVIKKCYNSAQIEGNKNVGGISGQLALPTVTDYKADLISCYNKGNIVGSDKAGSLIGRCGGKITVTKNYFYQTEGVNGVGKFESDVSESTISPEIISTQDDLKSFEEFTSWIENK